jgi:co-chaperonin GroES (HSP10)
MTTKNAWINRGAQAPDCRIRPWGDRIVVRPDERPNQTPSGIILPESKEPAQTGIVAASGPKAAIRLGARLIFARYAGAPIEVDGAWWIVLGIDDVLGELPDVSPAVAAAAEAVIRQVGPERAATLTEDELAELVDKELKTPAVARPIGAPPKLARQSSKGAKP